MKSKRGHEKDKTISPWLGGSITFLLSGMIPYFFCSLIIGFQSGGIIVLATISAMIGLFMFIFMIAEQGRSDRRAIILSLMNITICSVVVYLILLILFFPS